MSMTGEPPRKKSRACKVMPSLKFYDYTSQYDRILVAGKKNFYVDSKDLASKFTYFNCMFESEFVEKNKKTIHLDGISSQSLELFLLAAENPKKFKGTRSNLPGLTQITSFFSAPELLIDVISVKSNFEKFARVDWLELAEEHAIPELKNLVENSFLSGLNDESGERFYSFRIALRYGLEKVMKSVLDWLMYTSYQKYDHFMNRVLDGAQQSGVKMIKLITSQVFSLDDTNLIHNYKRLTAMMCNNWFNLIKEDVECSFLRIFQENKNLFQSLSLIIKDSHCDMLGSVKDLVKSAQRPNISSEPY